MAYINIITLQEAKDYLRVDISDTDTEIIRMINSALSYIEKVTNHILDVRDITYLAVNGCVRVYDYPINSEVTTGLEVTKKNGYNTYQLGIETTDIILNVGYALVNVPSELKDVALEMIDLMYYANETGRDYKKDLSQLSKDILNSYRRHIL